MEIDEQKLYIGALVFLVIGTFVIVGLPTGGSGVNPQPPSATGNSYNTTSDGVRYTVHPSKLLQGCPGGRDCIPSIDNPRFQSPDEATWLNKDDLVIGVEIDGRAKAYPLRILNVHEVVNDKLAGRPIVVTYCPLCRSGLVYSRTVNGRNLTFGVSGKLLNANLVMYDRQTETYWSQIKGEAIVGPLVPTELKLHPNSLTTWGEWRNAHPDTLVLSRDTGIYPPEIYGSDPYQGYQQNSQVGFGVGEVDDRLPPKEIVYGVTVGGVAKAYPEEVVKERNVINDEINGVPVLVVEDPKEGSVKIFVRRVSNTTFTFTVSGEELVDQNGNRWSFDGKALEGPHKGEHLSRLNAHGFFWFAWSEFHPETRVYGGK